MAKKQKKDELLIINMESVTVENVPIIIEALKKQMEETEGFVYIKKIDEAIKGIGYIDSLNTVKECKEAIMMYINRQDSSNLADEYLKAKGYNLEIPQYKVSGYPVAEILDEIYSKLISLSVEERRKELSSGITKMEKYLTEQQRLSKDFLGLKNLFTKSM